MGSSTTPPGVTTPPGDNAGSTSPSGSGTGSGTSTTSTSGSGGSAPSGPSEAELKAIRNNAATFVSMLLTWGMSVTPQMKNLAQHIAQQGGNTAMFQAAVRKTKDYAHRFPGIMKSNGTLRMSESQYIAGYNSARDFAATIGRPYNQHQYGFAVKQGNSPSEIRDKLQATDILKQHRPLLNQFSEYLMATGVIKQPLKDKELLKFIMKEGPVEWTQAWQTAQEAGLLAQYNIDVGKPKSGSDLSYKDLKQLQEGLLPGQTVDVQALAAGAEALPASKLYKLGITAHDIATMAYKGKNWQGIANRVQLALGTARETASETRANPQMTEQGQRAGTPSGQHIQATE